MPRNDFENVLVKSLNNFYRDKKAFAYRLIQTKYVNQHIDILSDSKILKYYLAIECKSIKSKKLYFNSHFSGDQIDRENIFIQKTGRKGFLAVEFRMGIGKKREAYLIPWEIIFKRYTNFKKCNKRKDNGFSYEEVKKIGTNLKREKGKYRFKPSNF